MNAINERRSIRKYKQDTVSNEDIKKIIESGILAPSAKNRQPWKYIVFSGQSKKEILDVMEQGLIRERDINQTLPDSHSGLPDAFNTLKIMREAPILIMIENTNGRSPFDSIDTDNRITEICDTLSIGASIQNMLLTATEMGLGTLWIANTCFAYEELCQYLNIKGQLIGAITIGIPDESPNPRPRKPFNEVVEFR